MKHNSVSQITRNQTAIWLRDTVQRWVTRHNAVPGAPRASIIALPWSPALLSTGPFRGDGGLLVDFTPRNGGPASAIWVAASGGAVRCSCDDEVEIPTYDLGGFTSASELTERLDAAAKILLDARGDEQEEAGCAR